MMNLATIRIASAAALAIGAAAIGSALHLPAVAAQTYQQQIVPMITGTCATSTACDQQTNTSNGPGFKGISASGNGSVGQTEFKSTSSTNFHAGVLGQDISTSGSFDAGVFGKSSAGIGVEGTSVNGNGVEALSTNQSALFSQSNTADGAQVISLGNDGTNSSTQNNSTSAKQGRSGVWGHDDSTDGGRLNVGVEGSSTNGIGVQANSSGYVGGNIVGGGEINMGGNDVPALSVVGGPGGPAFLMMACSAASDSPCTAVASSRKFTLDSGGNITITGEIFTGGSCLKGCIAGNRISRRIVSYAPRQTVPSIDDFGEAQLVNGRAYVPLSADFANVVDGRAGYLVFLTPEGDNKGLYVTQKTHAGFVVRESQGGHSSVAFSYRIVAKPFGVDQPRLPAEVVGTRQLR
jgi:hypothetical protein